MCHSMASSMLLVAYSTAIFAARFTEKQISGSDGGSFCATRPPLGRVDEGRNREMRAIV